MEVVTELRELRGLPKGLLELPANELHAALGGPSLIHLQGRQQPALFVSILMHGNETVGWDALRAVIKHYGNDEDGFVLPRSLSIFIANTSAAEAGVRHLPEQPDFNRVWPGGNQLDCAEAHLMKDVLDRMADREIFAAIDLHNNTGMNPHYACVNVLEHEALHLATLFSRTVVYFVRPRGVASMAMAALGPSVTLECGKVGDKKGIAHAVEYLDACLHLSSLPTHPVPPHDINLFHTVAVVRVASDMGIAFDVAGSELNFHSDLERLNFRELAVGTSFAEVNTSKRTIIVSDEDDHDVSDKYFVVEEGQLRTRLPVMPSMLTQDIDVIRQDCLCYLMERYSDHLGDAG